LELNGEANNFAGGGGTTFLVVGDGQKLVEYPPTLSVSTLVNHLKAVSSRMLRKEFSDLAARGAHLWTPSYFAASAGGAQIERPREYVEAQEKPS
jgi:putative transposase